MNKNMTSMENIGELYECLESMLEMSPDHGKITMTIHMRDGIPQRFETNREESIFFKGGCK
ncbi:MAG: hypothetical protein WBI82_05400 [Sphaerochaeta sp.]